jgi:branched-subunit amino acid ABC-type transport system permease component
MGSPVITPCADLGLTLAHVVDVAAQVLLITLVALGLYIVFGMMRIINMAHGEMFMLGAFVVAYGLDHGISFWLALVLAPLIVGLFGILLERTVVRPLHRRADLSTLLATAGVSIILQRGVTLWLGSKPQEVPAPIRGNFSILGQPYITYKVVAMGIALAVIVGIVGLIRATTFGLRARAVIEDPTMAEAFGINSARMNMAAFGLGTALAGLGGALIAPLVSVVPTMGLDWVVRSFMVVIVGGTGALVGALGGGALIGGSSGILTIVLNATLASIIVLGIAMVVVLVRPRGLFGGPSERR